MRGQPDGFLGPALFFQQVRKRFNARSFAAQNVSLKLQVGRFAEDNDRVQVWEKFQFLVKIFGTIIERPFIHTIHHGMAARGIGEREASFELIEPADPEQFKQFGGERIGNFRLGIGGVRSGQWERTRRPPAREWSRGRGSRASGT